jgi:trehalose 6-phosphate phosphatase
MWLLTPKPSRARELALPALMPANALVQLAERSKLLLCLDYDGVLAEIATKPSRAFPAAGIRETLARLTQVSDRVTVAIVTGRTVAEARRLLATSRGLLFSGLLGLEIAGLDGISHIAPAALACASELDRVKAWLAQNVPAQQGFHIEDKGVAVGLHYRAVEPRLAHVIVERFTKFVAANTPRLKVMRLKMLVEAVPQAASKAHAMAALWETVTPPHVTVFLGDDVTDEDAFAALGPGDVGILVGRARPSHARYRLPSVTAVAAELRALADYFASVGS